MPNAVIIEAVRTPIGKRNGWLAGLHATELLAKAQTTVIERAGVEPEAVEQIIGGCVTQAGEQGLNITRNAWLAQGLPLEVASTTVDTQCGSSQQATNMAYALIGAGVVDVAMGCGVEIMSRVPMGATVPKDPAVGKPINANYWNHYEMTSQFDGAERIAKQWGITRNDTDAFGKLSQDRGAQAWAEDRFNSQIVPIDAPVGFEDGKPTEETHRVDRDGGLRDTTLEALAQLRTNMPDGVHTAGSSSQICDGAGAVLMMTREKANELGLTVRATLVDSCLVGSDPVLMLTGPIYATQKLLADNDLQMSDIDVTEINEAFASVVLAWEKELKPDMDMVNPNGGAIALGHPLGATGARLMTTLLHELERTGGRYGLQTMCEGGGQANVTILERL